MCCLGVWQDSGFGGWPSLLLKFFVLAIIFPLVSSLFIKYYASSYLSSAESRPENHISTAVAWGDGTGLFNTAILFPPLGKVWY